MALNVSRVTVGTAATALKSNETDGIHGQTVLLRNRSTAAVFIGPASVTTADGFEVSAGDSLTFDLEPKEELFAIAAAAGNRVDVLRLGV